MSVPVGVALKEYPRESVPEGVMVRVGVPVGVTVRVVVEEPLGLLLALLLALALALGVVLGEAEGDLVEEGEGVLLVVPLLLDVAEALAVAVWRGEALGQVDTERVELAEAVELGERVPSGGPSETVNCRVAMELGVAERDVGAVTLAEPEGVPWGVGLGLPLAQEECVGREGEALGDAGALGEALRVPVALRERKAVGSVGEAEAEDDMLRTAVADLRAVLLWEGLALREGVDVGDGHCEGLPEKLLLRVPSGGVADGQCEESADCELVGEAERHSEGLPDTVFCDEVLREGEPEGVEERQSVEEEESVACAVGERKPLGQADGEADAELEWEPLAHADGVRIVDWEREVETQGEGDATAVPECEDELQALVEGVIEGDAEGEAGEALGVPEPERA